MVLPPARSILLRSRSPRSRNPSDPLIADLIAEPRENSNKARIIQKDLDKHGTTPGCPRCSEIDVGNRLSKGTHSEACRHSFYDLFKSSDDSKWARAAYGLQRRISHRRDLYQPEHFPSSPVDLNQADMEPPPAKNPRRAGDNDHGPDADDEDDDDDLREPDPKRVRLDEGEELDSGYDPENAELFFDGEDDDVEQLSHPID